MSLRIVMLLSLLALACESPKEPAAPAATQGAATTAVQTDAATSPHALATTTKAPPPPVPREEGSGEQQFVVIPQHVPLYTAASTEGQAFQGTRTVKEGSPLSKDDSFYTFRLLAEEGDWLKVQSVGLYDEIDSHCGGIQPEALDQIEVELYVKASDVAPVLDKPLSVKTEKGELRLLPGLAFSPTSGPLVELDLPEGYVFPEKFPEAVRSNRYAHAASVKKRTEYIVCGDTELRESKVSSCSNEGNVFDLAPKGDEKKLYYTARVRTPCIEYVRDDLHKGPLPVEPLKQALSGMDTAQLMGSADSSTAFGMMDGTLGSPTYEVDAYDIQPGSGVYAPDGKSLGKVMGKDPVRFYFSADGSNEKRTCVRVLSSCSLVHDSNEACARLEPEPPFSLCFDAEKTTFQKVEEMFGFGLGFGAGMTGAGGMEAHISVSTGGGKGQLRSDVVKP